MTQGSDYDIGTIKFSRRDAEMCGMRVFQVMRSRRRSGARRWSNSARTTEAFERTALQLTVLVAIANTDGEIRASEYERLHAIAERLSTAATRDRVVTKLQMLLAVPPSDEDVLRLLITAGSIGRLTRRMVDDITELAHADDHIHEREDRLLRLMSAIGGARPMSLRHTSPPALDEHEQELLDRVRAQLRAEAERDAREDAAAA